MNPAARFTLLLPASALALGLALAADPVAASEPVDALDTAAGAISMGPLPPVSDAGLTADTAPQHLGAKILFVNFDGADMNSCNNNDPSNNCSTIFGGTVLPFSGDAVKRASIVQVIRRRVQDFGITVTDQRPQSGDYDMEMVGEWQGANPEFAGIAPNIDCFDATGGETSFTLEATTSTDGIAEIALQELAHTWGLEHIDEQADLLYPTTQGTNKSFRDECYKIVSDTDLTPTNGFCNAVHTNFCNFSYQNSYQEMLFLFGPSVPDTFAPTVAILNPENGAVIDGGSLDLVIQLSDDQTPAVIATELLIESDALPEPVETSGSYASPGELTFPIDGLPDGTYTVRVDIEDESDNPASDEISFTVVGNPQDGDEGGAGESEGGDESGGGDEVDDSASTGDDGESGDGTSDPGIVDPGPTSADGCDCRTGEDGDGRPGAMAALLGLLLVIPRRRRRS